MPSQITERYEDKENNPAVKDFLGVNTQAGRTAIGETEFAWLENVMPVGHANLKAVPFQSAALATVPASTVTYWKYVNLLNVDYLAIFTNDGAGRLLNLSTYVFTTIGAANTFALPVACAQWENTRLLIVDANNYYSWDGTLLLKNGSVESVTITLAGSGYVALATATFAGGGGLGAAGTVYMTLVGAQTVTAGGLGYVVGQLLTLAGGVSTTPGKLRVDTVGGGGVITAVSVYDGGAYSTLPASPNAVTGGTGAGATITTAWGVDSVVVTNGGTVPYNTAPTVTFSASPGVTATGASVLLAGPDGGQSIASFAGRVWVTKGRTFSFSAPVSFSDFTTVNAGGSFIVTDETLKSDITGTFAANNFLYYWGNSSIGVISDVRVVGAPAVTVFSNNNVSPIIGTNLARSIFPYYRNIGFATSFGFYALVGASPQKISDPLDGMFDRINFSAVVSGGIVKLFNILCMAFCFRYNDPDTSATRTLLALHFNKKWFFCSQGNALTMIADAFRSGVPALYGTDGMHIYKLFDDTASAIATKVVSALWPMKQPTRTKQVLKGGVEIRTPDVLTEINLQLDTNWASYPLQLTADNLGEWVNAAGDRGHWFNALGVNGDWVTIGFQIFQGNVEGYGRYVGYTITSESPGYAIEGLLMQHELKGQWDTKAD